MHVPAVRGPIFTQSVAQKRKVLNPNVAELKLLKKTDSQVDVSMEQLSAQAQCQVHGVSQPVAQLYQSECVYRSKCEDSHPVKIQTWMGGV